MSWNNVSDIKNIKIWTDYTDSTQGHLFVNDNHQLKLNVGISFTLKSGTTEGPTEDEVYSALSLIDNQDSGPLKYLNIVEAGRYTSVYDPNHVNINPENDIDDGIYDFGFTYYVSSPVNLNAETRSESVALRVAYSITNDDGTTTDVVKQTSAKGNYYTKTYVSVICYPSILYGMDGQNRKNIVSTNGIVSSATYHNVHYDTSGNQSYYITISINDSYFKLFYLDGAHEPEDVSTLTPQFINYTKDSPMWDHVNNCFFPNIQCGEKKYTVTAEVRSNLSYDAYSPLFDADIPIDQKENQIIFVAVQTDAKRTDYNWTCNYYQYLNIHDQFGNSIYIITGFKDNNIHIKSVS